MTLVQKAIEFVFHPPRYWIKCLHRESSTKDTVKGVLRGISEYVVEHPKGPVALILTELRRHGVQLTEDMVIKEPGEVDLERVQRSSSLALSGKLVR